MNPGIVIKAEQCAREIERAGFKCTLTLNGANKRKRFEEHLELASEIVASWPAWKQNLLERN